MQGLRADIRRRGTALVPAVLCLAGCLADDAPTRTVASNPFNKPPQPAPPPNVSAYAPATLETAAKVDALGRKLITANPQVAMRPLFRTIGSPQPEIFHHGTSELIVTEGLVKQCKSENALAAVLCNEMGKMVSEREALAGTAARVPDRPPPVDVRVGNDNAGSFGPPDETHLAEMAKYGTDRHRPAAAPLVLPPDPQLLARNYLTKAGYQPADLDAVKPLLEDADKNSAFEKQMSPAASTRPWK